MATYTKKLLSGSTDGKGILVSQTATPGTIIHTGSSNPSVIQEVWLYAVNNDTVARLLTVEWGGTTSPAEVIKVNLSLTNYGLVTIAPGLLLKGNATPLVIRAFAASGTTVSIHGFVNEIS